MMKEEKNIYFSYQLECDSQETLKNNKKSMLLYLKNFDPYELKYSLLPDRMFYGKDETPTQTISPDNKEKIIKYERSFQFGSLTKQPYSSIKDNLMLVYGDSNLVKDDVQLFHYTEKMMIHQYIAIPQIDKMFDEDYFNFEWDMHVGKNFAEHKDSYQRDHFIHQIRDMYSILMLLGRHGFYESALKIMSDNNCSKISQYTCQKMNEFLENKCGSFSFLQTLDKEDFITNAQNDINFIDSFKKSFGYKVADSVSSDNYSYEKGYFMKYVIYASAILAALFHDMGYPICHFLATRNRVSEYNPTMYMFTHNEIESFDHIASLLSSSLLFTIVLPKDIKKALQPEDGNKYNHGAYSAIAFLLQFYNSGIIFSLPVEKQCAIELAAVAIYDHTVKYNVQEYKKDNTFFQPIYRQNPIAFLLRLCDDLQEWDRRYFEISSESDLLICSRCLTPNLIYTTQDDEDKANYGCFCSTPNEKPDENAGKNSNKPKGANSFRYQKFKKRKLYLITTANYMTSEVIGVKVKSGEKKALCFSINYDYYKLLNMTRINNTYAKYRLKELNDLKLLVKYQDFKSQSEGILDFNYIYLDYFMTSNPILIKVKILEKYLNQQGWLESAVKQENAQSGIETDDQTLLMISEKFKFLNIEQENGNQDSAESKTETLLDILNNGVFKFYVDVLKSSMKGVSDKEKLNTETENIIDSHFPINEFSEFYREIMKTLIYDCLLQYSKEFQFDKDCKIESFIDKDIYYKQYVPDNEEHFYNCVAAYCNVENDFNLYYLDAEEKKKIGKKGKTYVGYFTDLYFFELMNKSIQDKKVKNLEPSDNPDNSKTSKQ